jgi:putative transposase
MGWKVSNVLDQRLQFVNDYKTGDWNFSELCWEYGVSRQTGYKWLNRYEQQGLTGLQDQSRAPHHHPQAVNAQLIEWILAIKAKHPYWGARKIVAHLQRQSPEQKWPAVSTVGELLKQHGLTVGRKRRSVARAEEGPLAHAVAANRVWSIDFKGWFRTGDGQRCDPLTLIDNYSRYLLRCQAVPVESTACVKPIMEAAFREYGLPERIRSDNGPPFSTNGEAGLTALSVWWLKLGILPERIRPGRPQQNGRQERMHATLKQETASPPAGSVRQQQQRFDQFRREYNEERPHEALGQKPPACFYVCSSREYPKRLPALEYPSGWKVKRVQVGGKFCWSHSWRPFVSHALVNEYIGLEPIDDRHWRVWFAGWELGMVDAAMSRLYTKPEWQRKQAREAKRVSVGSTV